MKKVLIAVLLVIVLILATGCAAGPNELADPGNPEQAGFWLGLWHGFISPFTFIISLFNHNIGIYEVNNNGGWYNFGFMFGVSIIFGGGGGGAGSRACRKG